MTDHDLLVKIAADTEANKNSLGILFRTIEGNGQPGLKQRMTQMEAEHKLCKEQTSLNPQKQNNLIQWVMVAIMIGTAAIMIYKGG